MYYPYSRTVLLFLRDSAAACQTLDVATKSFENKEEDSVALFIMWKIENEQRINN